MWSPKLCVARSDAGPTGIRELGSVDPPGSFMEIGHKIISRVILSLLLIPVGQLSVTGRRMFTKYWLTA